MRYVAFILLSVGLFFAVRAISFGATTVETQSPPSFPDKIVFHDHYRCSKAADNTTITLTPIESGPAIEFSCVNCECRTEK